MSNNTSLANRTTHRVAWPVTFAPDRDIALHAAQLRWALNISANHGALTFLHSGSQPGRKNRAMFIVALRPRVVFVLVQ